MKASNLGAVVVGSASQAVVRAKRAQEYSARRAIFCVSDHWAPVVRFRPPRSRLFCVDATMLKGVVRSEPKNPADREPEDERVAKSVARDTAGPAETKI